ncbi:MAG TPA: glycosyltransferase family 4 protein, partial [Acidimicrobiales bacterium]|nr:glycosyltransferase family 4 protein [Acidimicrobiales bacterium]
MRVLHAAEFYPPSRGGAQEVVRQISERLARLGHDVTVATTRLAERRLGTLNGVRLEEFPVAGNRALGYRGDVASYQRFLRESRFDVVLSYACQQWTTDAFLEVADEVRAVKVCAPCGYSGLHDERYAAYFAELPRLLAKMDATVYHSAWYQDIELARSHGLANLHVIPNGAAAEEFRTAASADVERFRTRRDVRGALVLAVGTHTGTKGHLEAMTAFSLAPTGPATLLVVGNGSPGAGCFDRCAEQAMRLARVLRPAGKQILVRDLSRDELVVALEAADVLIHLSRVECSPIVLFEAAASGTPFLSSDAGNAREIAAWTGAGVVVGSRARGGEVRYSPWRAAAALTEMLRNQTLR